MNEERTLQTYLEYLRISARDPKSPITFDDVKNEELKMLMKEGKLNILHLCLDD